MSATPQLPPNRSRFGHIAIRVADATAARRFYEHGLGLQFVGFRPSGTGAFDLSDGSVNMTVLPYHGAEREVHQEGAEHIHFGLFVPDAAAVYQRLVEIGAMMLKESVKTRFEPVSAPQPDGSFKVADPDGNVIDVTGNSAEWRA